MEWKKLHMKFRYGIWRKQNEKRNNGVEWRNVDRAIRHAFIVCRCNKDTVDCVKKYIGYTNKSNSASLMSLYIRLKAEEEEK